MKLEGEMIGANPRKSNKVSVGWSFQSWLLSREKKQMPKPDQWPSWRIHFLGSLTLMAVKSIKFFFLCLGNCSQLLWGCPWLNKRW